MILSDSEEKIVKYVAKGFTRDEIAVFLKIKKNTVNKYIEKLRLKNGFKTLNQTMYEYGKEFRKK